MPSSPIAADRDQPDACPPDVGTLLAQNRIYDTILSNTPDSNYLFDLHGRFIYINRALREIWGKLADTALGKTFFELDYPPELAAKLHGQIQQVIHTRQPIRDETPYTGGHGTRAYEYILVPALGPDGEVIAVAGTTRDITARAEVEEKLRDAQTRLAATIAAAAVGTWVWHVQEDRVYADQPLAAMFAVPPEAAHGGSIANYLTAIHPEDIPAVRDVIEHCIFSGYSYESEYRLRHPDGGWRWVNARGHVERDEAGRALRFSGAVIDISARKRIEETVAAQANALRDADRRKDEFLAMLAHELRNPLASVSNAAAVLKETDDAENRTWAAGVIGRQTAQLARIVDDLLDVSRITRGRIQLRRKRLDAATVIASALEAAAPLIGEFSHTLTVRVPPEPLWLDADPTRLEQIILNLLTNAAKYTPPGGQITLDAFLEPNPSDTSEIVIAVQDNGIGIDAAHLPSIFDLFAQGERSIARDEGGLGIGLTIVRALCHLHGGRVTAASPGKGCGTLFTVRLPASAAPAPASHPSVSPAAGAPEPPRTASHRILVVDDNTDSASGLSRLLSRRGYEVQLAHDGLQALKTAASFQPAAVLLDIGLPTLDGYEVARRLRQSHPARPLLIVAVSGYGQDDDRAKSKAAGFDHHLVKPIEFGELQSLLTRSLAEQNASLSPSVN